MPLPNLQVPVQARVNLLISALDFKFRAGFASHKPWYGQMSEDKGAAGKTIVLPWADPCKRFSRFLGEFKVNPFILNAISTDCAPWHNNLLIDRDDALDQAFSIWEDQAKDMGVQSVKLGDDWTSLALRQNGATQPGFVWYDGKGVFDEAHPVDPRGVVSGTWRNLFKGVPPTTQNVIDVATSMMQGVKLPNGRTLAVRPTKIACSGALYYAFKEILKNDLVIRAINTAAGAGAGFGAATNVLKGEIEPVICETLAEDIEGIPGEPNVWYMYDDRYYKPCTTYWRRKPIVTPIISDADARVAELNAYIYQGRAHGTTLVSAPWWIARCESDGEAFT